MATAAPDLRWRPGVAVGSYNLVAPIGVGGMSELWLARRDAASPGDRVLKRVRPGREQNIGFANLLVYEGQLLRRLHHPNIACLHEMFQQDDGWVLVIEYVPGWDLRRILHCSARAGRRPPPDEAAFVALELARALAHAHSAHGADHRGGVIHFDVTPSNVLVGPGGCVKLTDFGVAREACRTNAWPPDHRRGKPAYMSPEQVSCKPLDERTDIFSLGVVLYETLTVQRLFRSGTTRETADRVRTMDLPARMRAATFLPTQLRRIILTALARDPAERYATAQDMVADLEAFLGDAAHLGPQLHATAAAVCGGWESAAPGSDPMASAPSLPAHRKLHVQLDLGGPAHVMASTTSQLVRLAGAGRITAATPVKLDDSEWCAASRVPILEALLTQRPVPQGPARLDRSALTRWLVYRWRAASTGRLRLCRRDARRDVYFRDGVVVHVATNLEQELLGAFLVRRGYVDLVGLRRALDDPQRREKPIGRMLVEDGLIGREALLAAVAEHLQDKLGRLLDWDGAVGIWEDGKAPRTGVPPLQCAMGPAIAQGVRQRLPHAERMALLSGQAQRFRRAPRAPFDVGDLDLRPEELGVLLRMGDAPRSLTDLEQLAADDVEREGLSVALYVLLHTGHISAV